MTVALPEQVFNPVLNQTTSYNDYYRHYVRAHRVVVRGSWGFDTHGYEDTTLTNNYMGIAVAVPLKE